MDKNEFAVLVSEMEGKKEEVTIAQIKEVLSCVDLLTNNILYKTIEVMASKKMEQEAKSEGSNDQL